MLDTHEVNDIARLMRSTLETLTAACPGELAYGLSLFPRGSCADASLLLGTYFHLETGAESVKYLAGHRDTDRWTHAFLVVDNHIVDITGDQFPNRAAVTVAKADAWFDQWLIHKQLATTQNGFEAFAEPSLPGYDKIVSHMRGLRGLDC